MKILVHIPTEQYGFASAEIEGTAEDAAIAYKSLSEAFRADSGLPSKEFDAFVDRYLSGEKNHVEEYQKMNDEQKKTVQIIKRSLARLKSRGLIADND